MAQNEWITYDMEADLETWLEKFKPSQVLKTSSSQVCGIAISVPISSNTLNNNTSQLEEGFQSLSSQKVNMRLLHVEEQATTVFVSTDQLILKVNSQNVDAVWRGLIMNLHEGQFGKKVHRVEVSLAADMNMMKTDYVICVYNEKLTGIYQSPNLNGKYLKENNNDPMSDSRNGVRNKNDKKAKIKKPCKCFNEGSCKIAKTHLSRSKLTQYLHICRFCFAKRGEEKIHPESQCDYKKTAAHKSLLRMTRSDDELVAEENITKSKEGSKFSVVARNVYPNCSCRSGGNKGCITSACKCIKFSQECLPSCGCGQACANMGLTRGEGKQVRIGESQVQGEGCFAEEDIGKGEYVGEYTGEIVLRADQLKKENPSKFLFEIGHNDFLLDAENHGSKLAKMNHKVEKRGANCVYKLKRAKGEWRVGVWAIKDIKKGQEIFANYSNSYRGHGLFTPTKKKNKKGRRKGANAEEKERQLPVIGRKGTKVDRKGQRPLIENQRLRSPSLATKTSHEKIKSSPILKEKSIEASSLIDLSTPLRIVDNNSNSETGKNRSPTNCDTAQPRVLKLDSITKLTPNQSLNEDVATDMFILNYKKENISMPMVTITPRENDICKEKLYNKLSEETVKTISNVGIKMSNLKANKENVRTPTVNITPKEKDICKRKLYNSATPLRSTPPIKVTPVRSSPRIKAKADEKLRQSSLVVE